MDNRSLTLMAVHAHPDDEATSTGGILAKYAAEGIRTILVTCTDGACGDGAGGAKPDEAGHDYQAVVDQRRSELQASCTILGIDHLELLDYRDSGMMGWPQNELPGSFWTTPIEESTARLVELMERYQPDVVVTYDPNGFYGHPDHIQAHRITMAAAQATGIPSKIYWPTFPRSMMAKFMERLKDAGMDTAEVESINEGNDTQEPLGSEDADIAAWIDCVAYADRKYDALAAHASQADNILFLKMGREVFAETMGHETFLLAFDKTNSELPESDLFASLRNSLT